MHESPTTDLRALTRPALPNKKLRVPKEKQKKKDTSSTQWLIEAISIYRSTIHVELFVVSVHKQVYIHTMCIWMELGM